MPINLVMFYTGRNVYRKEFSPAFKSKKRSNKWQEMARFGVDEPLNCGCFTECAMCMES
jgi:hypothetical protein